MTCLVEVETPDGGLVDHRGSARARTDELFVPPRLTGFQLGRGITCGRTLIGNQLHKTMNAGGLYELLWLIRYNGLSLFKPGVSPTRQVKLFGRGAGIRFKRSSDSTVLPEVQGISSEVRPRRPGKLRIWAKIGGARTNTLEVKVLPKPC